MPDPTGRVSHLPHFHRGVAWKEPCRVATTANITIATALNAGDTIDGVTLAAGDRVLVKDQSTGSQNGIYIAGASPARAYDMDQDGTTSVPAEEIAGAFVWVIAGTTNGATLWHTTNTSGGTLGSTTITWTEFSSGAADAILRYGGAAEWYYDHGGAAVGATETIDLADGNVHSIILDVACTLTFSGAVASIDGQDVASSFTLIVIQDGSGGNTITWPGSVVWEAGSAPTLDTTGNSVEILTFLTPDGGTTWYGFHGGSGLSDHDHSAAGAQGGATLSPATFNFPATNSPAQTSNGQAVWDSDDDVLTVGTGAARRTIGYVGSTTPASNGTATAGTSNETSRADHVHGNSSGLVGQLLIQDTPSASPLVFADILQNEAGTDLLYADI